MTDIALKPEVLPLEENFEDFFEYSLSGFVSTDPRGFIHRVNWRFAKWLGLDAEQLKGRRLSDFLSIGGKIYFETHLAPLLRLQGYFDEVALELAAKDGAKISVLVNAFERRDNAGNPLFIRLTVFKATDRRLYEKTLQDAKNAAEGNLSNERETSVLREQFVAVLGHDLRNPLGAITSGAMLLSLSPLSARDKTLVTMMSDSAARMAELIGNVMDFARSRMGSGIAVNLQPTFLGSLLQHVVDELRSAWPARKIATDFALSVPVTCDGARIGQLLSNLLANALTHGAKDGVVHVRAHSTGGSFELSVSNGGTEIPPAALGRLFEPFTRADAHASQNGLGLGLYIAAEIARAHKANLSATSSPEETNFTFSIIPHE